MEALQKCIDEISRILDPDQVSGDIATRITYRAAHGPETLLHEDMGDFTPGVIVRPKCTEDVAKVVKIVNEYGIPIVPRGAGTGLAGGARPCMGGVLMDLAKMDRVLSIDAARRLVDYLRQRSTQLDEAADKLQRSIDKEVGDA